MRAVASVTLWYSLCSRLCSVLQSVGMEFLEKHPEKGYWASASTMLEW